MWKRYIISLIKTTTWNKRKTLRITIAVHPFSSFFLVTPLTGASFECLLIQSVRYRNHYLLRGPRYRSLGHSSRLLLIRILSAGFFLSHSIRTSMIYLPLVPTIGIIIIIYIRSLGFP